MPSPLTQAGAITEPSRSAPLYVNRAQTGIWTQRSPMREAAVPYLYEKFYSGARYDSLIDGLNAEVTARLTLARRPGHSVYNSALFPPVNRFYEFRTFTGAAERIYVIADTAATVYDATGPNTKAAVLNKAGGAGSTFFQAVGNVLYMGDGVEQKKWRPAATDVGFDVKLSDWGTEGPADAPVDAPLAFLGAPCRFWAPGMSVQAGYAVLDANGNIQIMTGNQNAAQSFTNTIAPTVNNNGAIPANLPVSVAGGVTINGFTTPDAAFDGNPNTAAQSLFQHTHQVGVVTYQFAYAGATPTIITLNLLSAASAPIMAGTPMHQGVWYSTDNGTTWTSIWDQTAPNVRAKQWDHISLPPLTDINQVLVCAFMEAHDDCGEQIYELNIVVGTDTIPSDVTGDKTTGAIVPTWNTSLFGLTTDGTAIWSNAGPPSQWQAKQVYSLAGPSAAIIDTNGNLQVLQVSGVSGATEPTWATGAGELTTDGTVTWLNAGPGATVATKGFTWAYAYHTSDGEVSNASPISQPTGPVLGKMQIPLSGVGSANPACDEVWIFRTADGGATLLKVDSVVNPGGGLPWTFVDTHPDADLNILIQAAVAHENDPPPVGASNLEYHMSRIWMSVGNTVYFTRTASAIGGSPLSAVPGDNFFVFPSAVRRLWSCTIGLLVFTASDVFIVLGRGTVTDPFFSPGTYLRGYGLLHYDAFSVNGSTPTFLTSSRKLVAFDPGAGVTEPGFPIGDQFKRVTTAGFNAVLFDPSTAFVTWHEGSSGDSGLFVADGATGWFRMAPTSAPETGTTWSPFAAIAGGCSAVQSVETSPGVRDLLVGPAASGPGLPILRRDLGANTDNGVAFAYNVTIGSIVMAQPGQFADLEFITLDSVRVGTRPVVSLLLGEISGRFENLKRTRQDPPLLAPSKTLYNDRYSCGQNQTATICRHFQLKLAWKAEDAHNELLAYAIFGSVHNEKRSQ